jgi:hypothetical protein
MAKAPTKRMKTTKQRQEARIMKDDSIVSFVSFVPHSLPSGQALRAFVLK